MNLDTSLKVLRIVLGEVKTTNDCDITASYADSMINNFSLGNQNEKSNGTTPIIVVAAPAIDTQRQVKEIRLFNNDTVPHNVTLQLFDGTNTWIVGNSPTATPVAVGGSFVYTPESGVCCTGSGGGTSLTVEDDTGHTIASVGTLQMVGVVVSGSSPSAITNMTTITGADGVGTTAGSSIRLTSGAGGSGGTASVAGNVYMNAGLGGAGTTNTYGGSVFNRAGDGGSGTVIARGGSVGVIAGAGGTAASTGEGGSATFTGGSGYGSGRGGNAGFFGGASYGAAAAGSTYLQGGRAYGPNNGGPAEVLGGYGSTGGDIIVQSGDSSAGPGANVRIGFGAGTPPGNLQVHNDPSLLVAFYSWVAGAQLDNQTIFTTTRAMRVTAVIGRPDIVNGGAATLVIVKAASGTAPAGGTALTSTSMDLTGTANTNQTLTLSATLADITLAPGDSLCMVTTGVLAASAGCITVWGTPQ